MDNFKQLEYEMIFESDTVFVNPKDKEALQLSDKVAAFAKIREVIMKKRKEVEEKKEKLGDKITSLEDSIAELDADIFNITKEANKTNASIIEIQDKMDSTKQQIDILSKKVEKNREVLLEYLEYLYKKGNFLYQDGTLDALRATLLSGDGFADLINDVYFTGIVELTGNKLISDHRNFIAALYIKKIDLEEDEVQLKQLRKSLMLSKKLLDDKKEFKERLLTLSRGQESTYTTYLEQKIDLEKKLKVKQFQEKIKFDKAREAILEKYNCEYIDTLSEKNLEGASEECIKMNKVIHIESTLESIKDDAEGDTLFSWPIFPYAGLSAYYHDEEYYHDFGSSHEAIDIIAPQGTDIAAPADGYVVYIQMPDTDGYAYIALKHADGFVTVYGHVNEVLVSELDFVKK
ncbi:MAG: peptidoglycan DD-metalloendopeptidase family protein [Candidatus Peribacteria bacterium]|nr:MAG: peptidoglycan DD-metalloendopeptidase family protein [Candidatus Peribacteria bacterium]